MTTSIRIVAALLLLAGPAAAREAYFPPPEAQGGWRSLVTANVAPTAEQKTRISRTAGLNWDKLAEAWRYCGDLGGPHSLLVIRHGWVAAEWSNFGEPQTIASCTKALTGLAIGKLLDLSDAGRFTKRIRMDDPVYPFMPPSW